MEVFCPFPFSKLICNPSTQEAKEEARHNGCNPGNLEIDTRGLVQGSCGDIIQGQPGLHKDLAQTKL